MAFLGPLAARRGAVTAGAGRGGGGPGGGSAWGPATAVPASGASSASATAPRRVAAPAAWGRNSSSASLGRIGQHGPALANPARVRAPSPLQALLAPEARWPWPCPDAVIHGGGRGQQGWGNLPL